MAGTTAGTRLRMMEPASMAQTYTETESTRGCRIQGKSTSLWWMQKVAVPRVYATGNTSLCCGHYTKSREKVCGDRTCAEAIRRVFAIARLGGTENIRASCSVCFTVCHCALLGLPHPPQSQPLLLNPTVGALTIPQPRPWPPNP